MDKKNVVKYMRRIASLYGVRLHISKHFQHGLFNPEYGIIVIPSGMKTKYLVSIFCHELGHVVNIIEGNHPVYHNDDLFKKHEGTKRGVYLALKAEQYTDKKGAELCKIWFPDFKYEAAYTDPESDREFLSQYFMG